MHAPRATSPARAGLGRRVATWLLLGVLVLSGAPLEAGASVPACWRGARAAGSVEAAPGCCGRHRAVRERAFHLRESAPRPERSCCERSAEESAEPLTPPGPAATPAGCTCRLAPDGAPPAPTPHASDEPAPDRAIALSLQAPAPLAPAPAAASPRVHTPRARAGPRLHGAAARRLGHRRLERWLAELSMLRS